MTSSVKLGTRSVALVAPSRESEPSLSTKSSSDTPNTPFVERRASVSDANTTAARKHTFLHLLLIALEQLSPEPALLRLHHLQDLIQVELILERRSRERQHRRVPDDRKLEHVQLRKIRRRVLPTVLHPARKQAQRPLVDDPHLVRRVPRLRGPQILALIRRQFPGVRARGVARRALALHLRRMVRVLIRVLALLALLDVDVILMQRRLRSRWTDFMRMMSPELRYGSAPPLGVDDSLDDADTVNKHMSVNIQR